MLICRGTTSDFEQIVRWEYPAPYDVYNISPSDWEETIAYFHELQDDFVVIYDDEGTLLGFCSFGTDGQVPGGDYSASPLAFPLDLGMGIRPDLTGEGQGQKYLTAVLAYARQTFQPTHLRATIAVFNKRAQNMVKRANFVQTDQFTATNNGREFCIFLKQCT